MNNKRTSSDDAKKSEMPEMPEILVTTISDDKVDINATKVIGYV